MKRTNFTLKETKCAEMENNKNKNIIHSIDNLVFIQIFFLNRNYHMINISPTVFKINKYIKNYYYHLIIYQMNLLVFSAVLLLYLK